MGTSGRAARDPVADEELGDGGVQEDAGGDAVEDANGEDGCATLRVVRLVDADALDVIRLPI
jgi:hypothetical protein